MFSESARFFVFCGNYVKRSNPAISVTLSQLHQNYMCGIADALLNGVPSDDPFLYTYFFYLRTFCFSFHRFVLTERDVLVTGSNKILLVMFACIISSGSGVNFLRELFLRIVEKTAKIAKIQLEPAKF